MATLWDSERFRVGAWSLHLMTEDTERLTLLYMVGSSPVFLAWRADVNPRMDGRWFIYLFLCAAG
eukprot:CAMPEP_0206426178 /NCGR_PEP_ID=MMETSP0324_2-20121206/4220_1 /ASSEMBLY_ACC=CAM_ASM_000836 /TAXON_ID=2866 /ORGANISM="Crypthecodinium cohnii, Strain Seligo" /LENGTH=64 /DNA_ID=CAMNT_0053891077 /DNA_START=108 /DNA_END=302 /DNA_ORIENTATION=+